MVNILEEEWRGHQSHWDPTTTISHIEQTGRHHQHHSRQIGWRSLERKLYFLGLGEQTTHFCRDYSIRRTTWRAFHFHGIGEFEQEMDMNCTKKWESSQMCSMSTAMDKHRFFFRNFKSLAYIYFMYSVCTAHILESNIMIKVFFVSLYFWTISTIFSSTFAEPALSRNQIRHTVHKVITC